MPANPFETIQHIIKNRRSVFPPSYTSRIIAKDTMLSLLDCANTAPTHKLTQPWRFTVFQGTGLLRLANKLADLYKENTADELFIQKKYEATREKVMQSGGVIAIHVHYSGLLPAWEELAATACAVQNLWLAASAAGIGGYWSTPAFITKINDFLGLAANEQCLGFFYMGYHEEKPRPANRKPLSEIVKWEE